jgi:RNA polymerase sigma-70 factor, ECF subfamily
MSSLNWSHNLKMYIRLLLESKNRKQIMNISQEFLSNYSYAINLAKKLTKDQCLAEDIVQDVFLSIAKSGITIDGEKNFGAYLNVSIRNRYYNHVNKKKHAKHNGVNVELGKAYSVAAKHTDVNIDDSLSKALQNTSARLTLPLMLNVVHDYSYDEIAKIMNIPIGTVRSRINRAKTELRSRI